MSNTTVSFLLNSVTLTINFDLANQVLANGGNIDNVRHDATNYDVSWKSFYEVTSNKHYISKAVHILQNQANRLAAKAIAQYNYNKGFSQPKLQVVEFDLASTVREYTASGMTYENAFKLAESKQENARLKAAAKARRLAAA